MLFLPIRAETALLVSQQRMNELFTEPPRLTVQGIGDFGQKVVFAKLRCDAETEKLQAMAGIAKLLHVRL